MNDDGTWLALGIVAAVGLGAAAARGSRARGPSWVQAQKAGGAWRLPPNNGVWELPTEVDEVRHQTTRWPGAWGHLRSLAGLVMDLDDRVYGWRKMHELREDGYIMRGRVSVGGKKQRAWTGSTLFERNDGSLVDVGVLWISPNPADTPELFTVRPTLAGPRITPRREGSTDGSLAWTPRDDRWYPHFYGTRHGDWGQFNEPILGKRHQGFDWSMIASLSSRNDWRNWMVDGATERDPGLRRALGQIVTANPQAAAFEIRFDGPWMVVGDLLRDNPDPNDIVFLHGTSTTAWKRIQRQGLRPREAHGEPAAYGAHISRAKPSDPNAVYLTTQVGTASWAATDAARVTKSEPLIIEIRDLDPARLRADEDSGLAQGAWRRSLEVLGSVKYIGTIPPQKLNRHPDLTARAARSLRNS
jgi:hypothetical protein